MDLKQSIKILILSQVIFLIYGVGSIKAQGPIMLTNEQAASFTNVKKFMDESPNPDSAVVYLQKFSKNLDGVTHDLLSYQLHNYLTDLLVMSYRGDSTSTPEKWKKAGFARDMVNRLSHQKAGPLHLASNSLVIWAKLAEGKNYAVTADLVNTFIHTEVFAKDLYLDRSGRYGVMIYKMLIENPAQHELAEKLFAALDENFTKNQITVTEKTPYNERQTRAWLRYMYAGLNSIKANHVQNLQQKYKYLKQAFDFSPDAMDLNNAGFVHDIPFLFNPDKISFQKDYLDFLIEQKETGDKLVPVLSEMSLADPQYKEQLERAYNQGSGVKGDFQSFWVENINNRGFLMPPVELTLINSQKFIGEHQKGKWILVDFWGTWCAPCRAEHPDLENLYTSYIKPNEDKMTVLTIACNDEKEKVVEYMNEKKFTFPVAMADDKIEQQIGITYYPTKLLITPQGKYLRVPNSPKWVEFVKLYTGL